MRDHVWLTDDQMKRMAPCFPNSRGQPRVDDRKVLSAMIHVNRNGLRWRDAPAVYGPHKTFCNCWYRWSRTGVLDRIVAAVAGKSDHTDLLMMEAHRSQGAPYCRQPAAEKGAPDRRCIGRSKGGLNSKLQALAEARGRPLRLVLTAGQRRDDRGARVLIKALLAMKAIGGVMHARRRALRPALRGVATASSRLNMTRCCPGRATVSRTVLPGSRTGDA